MSLLSLPGFLMCAAILAWPRAGQAQGSKTEQGHGGGLNAHWASGPHAQRLMLGWETPVLWSRQSARSPGRLELTGVLGVSYWHATHGRQPASVWQLSAIPMLRWWPRGQGFYAEGGIGPTLFSHTHFADENISTALQFGTLLGVGYQFTPAVRVGLGVSHFSNAGIKKPNPGFTMLQLSYSYRY